jgi:nucleoside-triphosphatase THEP1
MAYALVIAGKGGTRSRAARKIVDALVARGIRVGGFVQRTLEVGPGGKVVELVRLRDGCTLPLARTGPAEGAGADTAGCSLAFDPAVFEAARRWIEADAPGAEVLVLDGLGKLELGGEGHRAAIAHALATAPLVLLAVRDDQLVYALEALRLGEPIAAYTEGDGAAALDAFVTDLERTVLTRLAGG